MSGDDPEEIDDPEVADYLASLPEGRLNVGKVPTRIAAKMFGEEMPGVRCPKCAWKPRGKMAWGCRCGHTWNTFATHGRCPACSFEWKDTQCSACEAWSPHDAWHVPAGRPN